MRPCADGSPARLGRILLEGEVSARPVVVPEVAAQTTSKMCLVQDDDVVEKLAAEGTNHAFGEGVCQGERSAVRTSVVPISFTRRRNSPP